MNTATCCCRRVQTTQSGTFPFSTTQHFSLPVFSRNTAWKRGQGTVLTEWRLSIAVRRRTQIWRCAWRKVPWSCHSPLQSRHLLGFAAARSVDVSRLRARSGLHTLFRVVLSTYLHRHHKKTECTDDAVGIFFFHVGSDPPGTFRCGCCGL